MITLMKKYPLTTVVLVAIVASVITVLLTLPHIARGALYFGTSFAMPNPADVTPTPIATTTEKTPDALPIIKVESKQEARATVSKSNEKQERIDWLKSEIARLTVELNSLEN